MPVLQHSLLDIYMYIYKIVNFSYTVYICMYTDHFYNSYTVYIYFRYSCIQGESPPPEHSYFKSQRLIKITYFFSRQLCYYQNKTPLSLKAGTPGPVIVSSQRGGVSAAGGGGRLVNNVPQECRNGRTNEQHVHLRRTCEPGYNRRGCSRRGSQTFH